MEFYIEKHSSTPIVNQIEEQIKLAVMMGIFRNGDTLPSIRDIEKQTGVNRSLIHKAYLALRRSGLLVLTRGKGTVVATTGDSPHSIDEKCRKWSKKIVSTVRQLEISPTAFARYLSRYAQESERNTPFILYADIYEETARQTAAEISKLWQVPVQGLTFQELKSALGKGGSRQRIIVNLFMYENLRALLSRNKSTIIPVELYRTNQANQRMAQIQSNASVLVVHLSQPSHRIRFIVSQLRKLMQYPDIKVVSTPIRDAESFRKLLDESQYDYYLVGPGVWVITPQDLRQDPRIIPLDAQLDPASLEAARIRAGVII